jgi:hypothetical protein
MMRTSSARKDSLSNAPQAGRLLSVKPYREGTPWTRRTGGDALREAYRKAGTADAWRLVRYDCGHMETAAMRAEIVAFLKRWL